MVRRPLTSVLFHSHKLFDASTLDSAHPRVLPLPRPVAQELVYLALFMWVLFGVKFFCTDSPAQSSQLPSVKRKQDSFGGHDLRKEARKREGEAAKKVEEEAAKKWEKEADKKWQRVHLPCQLARRQKHDSRSLRARSWQKCYRGHQDGCPQVQIFVVWCVIHLLPV